MFYAKYQHSAVKYENACTILQTRLKSHTISNKVETAWLFEKMAESVGFEPTCPFGQLDFEFSRRLLITCFLLSVSASLVHPQTRMKSGFFKGIARKY